jgi:hypothetical protein
VTASNSAGTTVRNVNVGIYSTPWGASLTDNLDAIEKGTGDVKPGDKMYVKPEDRVRIW